jgi:hypothetical protein
MMKRLMPQLWEQGVDPTETLPRLLQYPCRISKNPVTEGFRKGLAHGVIGSSDKVRVVEHRHLPRQGRDILPTPPF